MKPFCLQPLNPEDYRSQTRKSSLVLILLFAVLGVGCASLLANTLGTPGGNNFRWNLLGVLGGLAITLLLVKYHLSRQPFMAAAVYGWQLKRNLMRVTNQMHRIKPLAEAGDPLALKVLRFYHLALEQMHHLEGNDSQLLDMKAEKKQIEEKMQALEMDAHQTCLDKSWIKALSDRTAKE